jgi:sulfur-carrier protein adenylyltransferase/sulfurtransferase
VFDGLNTRFTTLGLIKDHHCGCCGDGEVLPFEQGDVPPMPLDVEEITCEQLEALPKPYVLLDVREPWECDIASIGGEEHVPLDQVPYAEIPAQQDDLVIVYCKGGVRSATAAHILHARGFTNVKSLAGGILAYRAQINPELAGY